MLEIVVHVAMSKYDAFYRTGGWRYRRDFEVRFLGELTRTAGLMPGDHVLELGCGQGFHSKILHDLGFRVTAADLSRAGIEHAQRSYSGPQYIAEDAANLVSRWPKRSEDAVFIRGMSWFHYRFEDARSTAAVSVLPSIVELIRDGGALILMIKTDYTGTDTAGGVYNHKWEDFTRLLRPYGEVLYRCDWKGRCLESETDALASGNGMALVMKVTAR